MPEFCQVTLNDRPAEVLRHPGREVPYDLLLQQHSDGIRVRLHAELDLDVDGSAFRGARPAHLFEDLLVPARAQRLDPELPRPRDDRDDRRCAGSDRFVGALFRRRGTVSVLRAEIDFQCQQRVRQRAVGAARVQLEVRRQVCEFMAREVGPGGPGFGKRAVADIADWPPPVALDRRIQKARVEVNVALRISLWNR